MFSGEFLTRFLIFLALSSKGYETDQAFFLPTKRGIVTFIWMTTFAGCISVDSSIQCGKFSPYLTFLMMPTFDSLKLINHLQFDSSV